MAYPERHTPLKDSGTDTVLCALDDIEDPGAREFRVGRREVFFVVQKEGRLFAYVSLCPHQGTPLDWKPNAFLTVGKDEIQCATHGARFTIEDGLCSFGPCPGQGLKPVAVRVAGGKILLNG